MLRPLLTAAVALLCLGCAPPGADDDDASEAAVAPDDDDATPTDDDDSTLVPPDPASLDWLACSGGVEGCADEGPYIDGTCCALGDNLVKLGFAGGSEVVDVETDGRWVVTCGGFGARFADLADPDDITMGGAATSRCQRIGMGPLTPEGDRVVYLAHHGDGWVSTPFLAGYTIDDAGQLTEVHHEAHAEILFEGLHFAHGHLYVATHAGGLRVYSVAETGALTFVGTVGGFDNARKLDSEGAWLYVLDDVELQVLSLADPAAPQRVSSVPLNGVPRDLDASPDRVYVALGNRGLDVFSRGKDGALTHEAAVVPEVGSTQAVAAGEGFVALANWSHLEILDPQLRRVGTQRTTTTPSFEQDLGVAVHGDLIIGDEWEGAHVYRWRPGYVAPDLHVDQDLISFQGSGPGSQSLTLRNRGFAELQVGPIETAAPSSFSIDPTSLVLQPGEVADVAVTLNDTQPGGLLRVLIDSNDPDPEQNPYRVPISAGDPGGVGEGDLLTQDWGFLDPTGEGDVMNLEGRVVVLAYFALF